MERAPQIGARLLYMQVRTAYKLKPLYLLPAWGIITLDARIIN
jgi:hypothetical protein